MAKPIIWAVFYDPSLNDLFYKDIEGIVPVRTKTLAYFVEDNPDLKFIRIVESIEKCDQTRLELTTIGMVSYNNNILDVVIAYDLWLKKGNFVLLHELNPLNKIKNAYQYRKAASRIINWLDLIYQEFISSEKQKLGQATLTS